MKDKIQNSLTDNSGDVVAELYALRAGLSTVSQHLDELIELGDELAYEESRVEGFDAQISINNRDLKNKENALTELDNQINPSSRESRINRKKFEKYSKYKNEHGYDRGWNYDIGKAILTIGASTFFAIICFVVLMVEIFVWEDIGLGGVFNCIILGICVIIAGGYGLWIFSVKVDKNRTMLRALKEATEEVDAELPKLTIERDKAAVDVDNLRKRAVELAEEREKVKQESEANIKDLTQNKIAPKAFEARIYSKVLEKTFSKLLNSADWHNIDLCIFYLQTGRADSIKECLLLADRQRQNDEIVGAIKQATASICSEIRSGLNALGRTMVTCINALSAQMEVSFNQLAEQQRQNVSALKSIETLGADILSAEQLNAALSAKAGTTSEQLMRDYRHVQNNLGISLY